MTYVGDNESVFFKTQAEKSGVSPDKGDAATVATSAIENVSVFSGSVAHTSMISRKANELADKLITEKVNRQKLESKIRDLQNNMEKNQKLISMQLSNDKTVKM